MKTKGEGARKVIYFASSYRIGLTALLTEQACAIVKEAPDRFLFVSGEKEQLPGLHEKLRMSGARCAVLEGLDDHIHFLKLVKDFCTLVKDFQPSVVHVQTNWQLAIAVWSKYRYRESYSLAYMLHGYRHNYALRSVFARFIIGLSLSLFVDKVYISSTFLRDRFKMLRKKTEILFLGVDEAFFEGSTPLPPLQEKGLIFPGEFRTGKNQEVLIHALRDYIDQTKDVSVKLTLPGRGKNLDSCKALAATLGIEKNVDFPGFVDRAQLLALYQRCHCAIIPTNIETFGLSIVEPFVLGRVVISRKVGIAGDLLIHAYNGFLFDTKAELVEILLNVFSDERLLRQVAAKTLEERDLFRWSNITRQYLRSVDNVYERGKVSPTLVPSRPQRVMIMWTTFLPYHVARIAHLKKRLDQIGYRLIAVEVASNDALYPFSDGSSAALIDYVSCFTKTSYRSLKARQIYDRVYSLLDHLKPDIIFAPATPFPSGMAAAKYRLENNSRSILMDDAWEHSDRRGELVRWVKKYIHKNIDGAFIPAPSHVSYFKRMGFERERMVFGVDVVDNAYFAARAAAARAKGDLLRARLGLPRSYFLFVGRMLRVKGISTLLHAYQKYARNSSPNEWGLVCVGEGEEMMKLEDAARDLPALKVVGIKTGEELCEYYGLASALIMPSDTETWGLVVNEAMASGLPVIVSRGCGCASTLVAEGTNGWSFEAGNATMLAEWMERLSALPAAEACAMGEESCRRINGWSLDTFADGVIEALYIPRREKANIIANALTNYWTGRISLYP